jgi:hypothetical protein
LEEGLAEYQGHRVAIAWEPGQEDNWRRTMRQVARDAIRDGQWVPFADIGKPEVWFAERDIDRGVLFYAEAYTAVDHIAAAYGRGRVRQFLDALADSPDNIDAAVRKALLVGFAEFEEAVRQSVLRLDTREVQVEAIVESARALDVIGRQQAGLIEDLNTYIRDRSGMRREQRLARVTAFRDRCQSLAGRVDKLAIPEVLSEPKDLYFRGFSTLVKGADALLRLERDGEAAAGQANAFFMEGGFLIDAARDRLITHLEDEHISTEPVFRQDAVPTPTGA